MAVKNLKISPMFMKIGIQGFFGSLITNLQSDFQNSRSRIQYGNLKKNLLNFYKNRYLKVFQVAD